MWENKPLHREMLPWSNAANRPLRIPEKQNQVTERTKQSDSDETPQASAQNLK